MIRTEVLTALFLLVSLALVGCGASESGGDIAPTATPVAEATPDEDDEETVDKAEPDDTVAEEAATEESTDTEQPASDLTGIARAQTIEQAESIASYRMLVEMSSDKNEVPLMVIEGRFAKEPPAEDITILASERGEEITMKARLVDGVRYFSAGEVWSEVPKFNLDELTVAKPAQFLSIIGEMDVVGVEESGGRSAIHLRADREILPDVQSGSDSIRFSEVDEAQLDLWVDELEGFVSRMLLTIADSGRDERVQIEFSYSDFNQPMEIVAPASDAVQSFPTPTPVPASDVTAILGFDFPIPEGSTITVYGATANVLAPISVPEGQALLVETMVANGFTQVGEPEERAANEYFYTFENGERILTAAVFSVVEGKTTIQLGAVK